MPHKQVFATEGLEGDFRVMPCVIQGFEGRLIKVVKVIGTDIEQRVVRDKISVGKALLLHPQDNFVQAVFDVAALTSFRTAAISVLAYKHLAKGNQKVGIVGTGRVGFYTALILHRWLGVRELLVEDKSLEHLGNFLKGVGLTFPKLKVEGGNLNKLCGRCSSLFLTTNTRAPILSDKNAGHLKFISSIGADSDTLSELEGDILRDRSIFTDSKSNIGFGDLKRWQKAGLLRKRPVTELREITGRRRKIKGKALFVSTGIALHDALACQFLYESLK